MIAGIVMDLKTATTWPCYLSGSKDEINTAVTNKMPGLIAFRGNKKFLFDTPTWIDFQFYEMI